MNLTSKSRYALKILLDLAQLQEGEEPVQRHDIASRQGVPLKYLDQIMIRLRQNGLVLSNRGRLGGYQLTRPARDITVWDIFVAVEDSIFPVSCLEENTSECSIAPQCSTRVPWHIIYAAVQEVLEKITLARLKDATQENDLLHKKDHALDGLVREVNCRCGYPTGAGSFKSSKDD
jgi:Rrf2 family protein